MCIVCMISRVAPSLVGAELIPEDDQPEPHYRKCLNFHGPKTHENKLKPTKIGYFRRHTDENSRRKYVRRK
jgi:hypothetical protein